MKKREIAETLEEIDARVLTLQTQVAELRRNKPADTECVRSLRDEIARVNNRLEGNDGVLRRHNTEIKALQGHDGSVTHNAEVERTKLRHALDAVTAAAQAAISAVDDVGGLGECEEYRRIPCHVRLHLLTRLAHEIDHVVKSFKQKADADLADTEGV